jgi:hypothetical protein
VGTSRLIAHCAPPPSPCCQSVHLKLLDASQVSRDDCKDRHASSRWIGSSSTGHPHEVVCASASRGVRTLQ